ncbi:MAG: hypothetical protein FWH17_09190 [Oscillospiraceae bacterium]|nr:hypothetical protein [Oscillospiraceae bacterium]
MNKKILLYVSVVIVAAAITALSVFLIIRPTYPAELTPDPAYPTPTADPTDEDLLTFELPQWFIDKYGDKDVLVWFIAEMALVGFTDERLIAFNDALLERGADFVLWFISPEGAFGVDDYQFELQSYIERDNQVDLIFTGVISTGVYGKSNSYRNAYHNGLLLPLDSIMPDTLKDTFTFTEKRWAAMRINGEIYGFPTDPIYARVPTLEVKGDEVPEGITSDLSSLLPFLDSLDNQSDEYRLELLNHFEAVCNYLGYYYIGGGVAIDYEGQAFNLFEDDAFNTYVATARQFVETGYIIPEPDPELPPLSAMVYIGSGGAGDVMSNLERKSYVIGDEFNILTESSAVGIAKTSRHPEKALTLMSLLLSDRELADLLVYGVSDIDYRLEDGIVFSQAPQFMTWCTGLYAFTSPSHSDVLAKGEVLDRYNEQAQVCPITGFYFDDRGHEEAMLALVEIVDAYVFPPIVETYNVGGEVVIISNLPTHGILTGHEPNWANILAQLNTELKSAGIDAMVSEINGQYAEWHTIYGR